MELSLRQFQAKNILCEKQNHANLPWNQAIPHLRRPNNATKPPCILLLGIYGTDSIGFRDESVCVFVCVCVCVCKSRRME